MLEIVPSDGLNLSNATTSQNIMTAERLRSFLFNSRRVPFWNFSPANLTIGLEVEFFIGRASAREPELATRAEFLATTRQLVSNFGYQDLGLRDQPGRVSKDTEFGFVAIKPDFAWHILEVALPPRSDLEGIHSLLSCTLNEVDSALANVGLERLDFSCLPDIPSRMELVELDRLKGFSANAASLSRSQIVAAVFPALIASTHVHFNCSDEGALAKLPELYAIDTEAQTRFTRAKLFGGEIFSNVRTSLYESCLGDTYKLRTTPKTVPTSIDMYVDLFNGSPQIFPRDPFFPVRDLTYIRPTRFGTLEFRSACSHLDLELLLEIVDFRRNQVLSAYDLTTDVQLRARAK